MELDPEKKIAFSFFRQHPLMTLSTLSSDNQPQTAAVYIHIDDTFSCYFATSASTRKYANINGHAQVTLSAHDENLLMFGEVAGKAEIITDTEVVNTITKELQNIITSRKSTYWIPPIAQLAGGDYVIFKVTPLSVTFANYELSTSENPTPKLTTFDF